jgi:hypothetical protein
MAYMSQEKKRQIAPKIKKILKKYGMNGTLSVDNHSTLVLTLKSGRLDLLKDFDNSVNADLQFMGRPARTEPSKYLDVNPYHYRNQFSVKENRNFMIEIFEAMNCGNHDNSRAEIDYFDVGWYVRVYVGRWNKPFLLLK